LSRRKKSVLKSRFKKLKNNNCRGGEAPLLHKSLIYSLIAAVLGVLIVISPLFFMPTIKNAEYLETKSISQALSERMKAFEHAYDPRESIAQNIFNNLLILTAGFAAAVVVHLLAKAKFSH